MVFGRFLGLGWRNIEMLGQAGLMQDIGKVRLPPGLLGKTPPLSEAESEQLRAHVGYSVEMLRDSGNFPLEVIETVKGHHERYDGRLNFCCASERWVLRALAKQNKLSARQAV